MRSTHCGLILWILTTLSREILSTKITNFDVPRYYVIESDNVEPLVLDCEYDLESNVTSSLVVKWTKDDTTIYQWIYGYKPKAFPLMREQIDDTYEASQDDFHKYRALAINNPNVNNSGVYKCLVQTEKAVASAHGHLQIIVTSNMTMEVSHKTDHNETEVFCSVKNVFPQPKLKLWLNGDESLHIKSEEFVRNDFGFFNALATGSLLLTENSTKSDAFGCSLHIPGTNFSIWNHLQSDSATTNVIYLPLLLLVQVILALTVCK